MTRFSKLTSMCLAAAVLLIQTGCASGGLSSRMASWQGSELAELEQAWGPADNCRSVEGRRICRWLDTEPLMLSDSQSLQRVSCQRSVEINEQSVVTGWRWRGDECARAGQAVLARHEPLPSTNNLAAIGEDIQTDAD